MSEKGAGAKPPRSENKGRRQAERWGQHVTPGPQAWAAALAALGIMAPFVLHIHSPEKKGVRGLFPLHTALAALRWPPGAPRRACQALGSIQAPALSVPPARRAEQGVRAASQPFCGESGLSQELCFLAQRKPRDLEALDSSPRQPLRAPLSASPPHSYPLSLPLSVRASPGAEETGFRF